MAWGYLCAIMYLVTGPQIKWRETVVNRLAMVGRLALTNYLMQSVLCCALFYGWGFGLFGQLSRAVLPLIVVLIWLIQLVWSGWWLKRYTAGPMETVWRNLVRRRWQPLLQRR